MSLTKEKQNVKTEYLKEKLENFNFADILSDNTVLNEEIKTGEAINSSEDIYNQLKIIELKNKIAPENCISEKFYAFKNAITNMKNDCRENKEFFNKEDIEQLTGIDSLRDSVDEFNRKTSFNYMAEPCMIKLCGYLREVQKVCNQLENISLENDIKNYDEQLKLLKNDINKTDEEIIKPFSKLIKENDIPVKGFEKEDLFFTDKLSDAVKNNKKQIADFNSIIDKKNQELYILFDNPENPQKKIDCIEALKTSADLSYHKQRIDAPSVEELETQNNELKMLENERNSSEFLMKQKKAEITANYNEIKKIDDEEPGTEIEYYNTGKVFIYRNEALKVLDKYADICVNSGDSSEIDAFKKDCRNKTDRQLGEIVSKLEETYRKTHENDIAFDENVYDVKRLDNEIKSKKASLLQLAGAIKKDREIDEKFNSVIQNLGNSGMDDKVYKRFSEKCEGIFNSKINRNQYIALSRKFEESMNNLIEKKDLYDASVNRKNTIENTKNKLIQGRNQLDSMKVDITFKVQGYIGDKMKKTDETVNKNVNGLDNLQNNNYRISLLQKKAEKMLNDMEAGRRFGHINSSEFNLMRNKLSDFVKEPTAENAENMFNAAKEYQQKKQSSYRSKLLSPAMRNQRLNIASDIMDISSQVKSVYENLEYQRTNCERIKNGFNKCLSENSLKSKMNFLTDENEFDAKYQEYANKINSIGADLREKTDDCVSFIEKTDKKFAHISLSDKEIDISDIVKTDKGNQYKFNKKAEIQVESPAMFK